MASEPVMLRLAFREEGKWWNAYIAKMGTMNGALPLGRTRIRLVEASPLARETFMACMKTLFQEHVVLHGADRPTEFETRTAPEHERSGHA